MIRLLRLLAFLALAGCGSGAPSGTPVPSGVEIPGNTVASVIVTADHSVGSDYLVSVTFRTAVGKEYSVEYCDTPIKVGDVVRLREYSVGTMLIFVNGVQVGDIIDWDATEAEIDRVSRGEASRDFSRCSCGNDREWRGADGWICPVCGKREGAGE